MRRILPVLLALLVAAPVALAAHVSSSPTASARLAERISDNSWAVVVDWAVNCSGAGAEPNYYGDLTLVDADTGERMYMGGISSASGSTRQPVERRAMPRRVYPELRASCGDGGGTNHGSDTHTVVGGAVEVPAKGDEDGDGTIDGAGGGTNPDRRPGGPADPLTAGGCAVERRGTNGDDRLGGTSGGDLIYGLGGKDIISGRGGADCLVGGAGTDALNGDGGADRLTGGLSGDVIGGGAGGDFLDGGAGGDLLNGAGGVDRFDAGAGNDRVMARDGRRETVRCGSGRDRATVDRRDRVRGCEIVVRG